MFDFSAYNIFRMFDILDVTFDMFDFAVYSMSNIESYMKDFPLFVDERLRHRFFMLLLVL